MIQLRQCGDQRRSCLERDALLYFLSAHFMLGLEKASSEEERMRIMAPSPIQNAAPFEGSKFRLRLARLGTTEIGQQACISIF